MNRTVVVFVVGIFAACLAGCSAQVPAGAPAPPSYGQSRAIDQDIDATHAGMPALASPSASNEERDVSPLPWRNEEQMDQQRAQTGQLPQ